MAKFRIVKRGSWYVPQRKAGEAWYDFTVDEPGDPWMGKTTLQAAREAITAGPIERGADEFIEEIKR